MRRKHLPDTQYYMAVSIRCNANFRDMALVAVVELLRQSQLTARHQFFFYFHFSFFSISISGCSCANNGALCASYFFFFKRSFRHSFDSVFASSPLERREGGSCTAPIPLYCSNAKYLFSKLTTLCAMRFCIQIISVSLLYGRVLVFSSPIFFSEKLDFHYRFLHTNIVRLPSMRTLYVANNTHACDFAILLLNKYFTGKCTFCALESVCSRCVCTLHLCPAVRMYAYGRIAEMCEAERKMVYANLRRC